MTFTAVDTAGNPSSAMLPQGINVTPTGQIQGTPQNTGSTSFLVQAQDNQSRVVIQALQLTVESQPAKSGGCAAAPGESSGLSGLLLLGLVALGAGRRRGKSGGTRMGERKGVMFMKRSASLGALVSGLLALAGPAQAQQWVSTPGSYIPLGSAGLPVDQNAKGQPAGEISGIVTGTDNGVAVITLGGTNNPWSFQYGGSTYSTVSVSVDGFISLGDAESGTGNCGCYSDTDPNAPPACSAVFTTCTNGCGSTVAGATGCCQVDNACINAGNNFCVGGQQSCGGNCCSSCGAHNPQNLDNYDGQPSTGQISAWFEDLDDSVSKGIRYLDGTDALGNHFLTIDYHGVQTSPNGVANAVRRTIKGGRRATTSPSPFISPPPVMASSR